MLSRDLTSVFNYVFDQLLPPALRDARWFMGIWFSIVFKDKKNIFMDFKQNVHKMTDEEYAAVYLETRDAILKRETDLNKRCVEAITAGIVGDNVIDVGCGSGYMVERLKAEYPKKTIHGLDIALTNAQLGKDYYYSGFAENLNMIGDRMYDTVICSHVLEHVRDFFLALSELRRVTKHRLIIVLPCQREYKYTFDLHIHFFQYTQSFLNHIRGNGECRVIGGDIFYVEDME